MPTTALPAPVSLTTAAEIVRPLLASVPSGLRKGAAAPRIHVEGDAGNGKTTMLIHEARRAGFVSTVIINADTLDVGDLSMLVDTGVGVIKYLPPAHLLALTVEADRAGIADAWRHRINGSQADGDPTKGHTLLVFDDFANANFAQQAMCHELFLNHRLGPTGIPLRDDVMVAATSNLVRRGYASHGLSTPMRTRIHCHLVVQVTADEWLAWARAKGISALVIAFLTRRPELLHGERVEGDANEANPRTWDQLASVLDFWLPLDTQALLSAVAGAVGTVAATEFTAFLRDGTTAPSSAEIVASPESADACLDRPDAALVAVEHAYAAVRRDEDS